MLYRVVRIQYFIHSIVVKQCDKSYRFQYKSNWIELRNCKRYALHPTQKRVRVHYRDMQTNRVSITRICSFIRIDNNNLNSNQFPDVTATRSLSAHIMTHKPFTIYIMMIKRHCKLNKHTIEKFGSRSHGMCSVHQKYNSFC